jgi:predicted ATPase
MSDSTGPGRLYGLTIAGFKLLEDVTLDGLGRLNVLVGPNGSGKSTLLEVIQFLGDAARTNLAEAVAHHGGFERLLTRPGTNEEDSGGQRHIQIIVRAIVTKHASETALDNYDLTFWPLATSRAVAQAEDFRFKRRGGQGRRITLRNGKLVTPRGERALDKDAFGLAVLPYLAPSDGGTEIRKIQELFTTFRVFDVNAAYARRPSPIGSERQTLSSDAANLASFLLWLNRDHSDTYLHLQDDARQIVPGLERLEIVEDGGAQSTARIAITDRGRRGSTPLADASFGTVRALSLLAMLHDPSPPLLTCIEEIDHGLHPYAFDLLVARLRDASARTQFIIATHSPALVNRLLPHEIIVCERDLDAGVARIPAIDRDTIRKMVDASELGVGELWFSGALGGVPQ